MAVFVVALDFYICGSMLGIFGCARAVFIAGASACTDCMPSYTFSNLSS